MQLTRQPGGLRVPLGVLDHPARQWQGLWILDLTRAGGHAAVICGTQSGKTTLLRSLVLSALDAGKMREQDSHLGIVIVR